MISKSLLALVFSFTAATSLSSQASTVYGFTAGYAPSQWTTLLTGTPAGGGAPVAVSNDGSTLTITGGDSGCAIQAICDIRYDLTSAPVVATTFSFSWTYTSTDIDGPGHDVFGYQTGGVETVLSPPNLGPSSGSGTLSVLVAAGHSFGWVLHCGDCLLGNATIVIDNFSATPMDVLPEPGSMVLVGVGLVGLSAIRRRGLRGLFGAPLQR